MSTRLKYDAASPHGRLLADAVGKIIEARGQVDRVLDAAKSMNNGADTAAVEVEFGLGAGKGTDMMYFLQAISDAMNGQPLKDISAQLDQG